MFQDHYLSFQTAGGHMIVCSCTKFTGFGLVALLTEINTVFRFLAGLFQATQLDRSHKLMYRLVLIICVPTNIVFRFIVLAWMHCFMLTQWETLSLVEFLLPTIGTAYVLFLNVKIFRSTCKKLIATRENVYYRDATANDVKEKREDKVA